jgi:ABC-type amino acid transport system permease subunit
MFSSTWLRDHESLAALVFIILSLGLTGIFSWVERRFFHR